MASAHAQQAPAATLPSATPLSSASSAPTADDSRAAAPAMVAPADAAVTAATPAPVAAAGVAAPVDASPAPAPADTAPAGTLDQPTQAEQDYNALYGNQDYNAVADPTLPTPAELPVSYDPWEPLNRRVHAFNNVVDRRIATPLARAYVAVVPRPVRLGVSNFFNNLGQPISAVNALLQGKPKQAAQALGRFALNTTLGMGGLLDPATDAHLPNHSEDFGQTLGVWGWKRSRYVELPLFGPRTLRDVFGLVGDAPLAPLRQIGSDPPRIFLQGLQLVDIRTQLFAIDSMRAGATDEYALFRDAWLQRRRYQIFGDRTSRDGGNSDLPAYLQEDQSNPTVPADAMPGIPVMP
jgi:phospholipid-binding lipoprotein MlaA